MSEGGGEGSRQDHAHSASHRVANVSKVFPFQDSCAICNLKTARKEKKRKEKRKEKKR
jgi:hypothetical protein